MTAMTGKLRSVGLVSLIAAAVAIHTSSSLASPENAASYVSDAQKLLAKGELRAAEIQLRNAVRVNPNDPDIHAQLARLYLEMGNLPAAEVEGRLARQDHGSPDVIDPLLADALMRENKVNDLFQLIQPAKRADKAESHVRLDLGLVHLGLGERPQAESLLRDAERLDPAAWQPKLAMARLLAVKKDIKGANAELAAAHAIAADEPEINWLIGVLLRANGDESSALAQFDQILASHPDYIAALISRVEINLSKNDLADAKSDIDRMLKLAPASVPALYFHAMLLARQGHLKEADDVLTAASVSFSTIPRVLLLAGTIKYALGNYNEAESYLERYIGRTPDDSIAHRMLAQMAMRRHDYQRAIKLLQPSTEANPTDLPSVTMLAQAYQATGQRDEALKLYGRAAKLRPDDVVTQTQFALGQLRAGNIDTGTSDLETIVQSRKGSNVAGPLLILTLLRTGQLENAADTAEAMLKKDGNDLIALNSLGLIREAQHEFPEAEQIFNKIVKADPNLLQVEQNLGDLYDALGKQDEAEKVWTDILQKQPNNVTALLALAHEAAEKKDGDRVVDLLQRAQRATPKNPVPGITLVRFYAFEKNWDMAFDALLTLEGNFPGNFSVIQLAAALRLQRNDPRGAASEAEQLVVSDPTSARAFAVYAKYQDLAGDKEGALGSLEKANSLEPDNPAYMKDLVDYSFKAKGANAAREMARSFAPKHQALSDILYAQVYFREDRVHDAISALTQAQQEHPDPSVLMLLSQLTFQSGDRTSAEAILQSWLKNHADDVEVQLALGDIYMAGHQTELEQRLYERLLAKTPDQPTALNNLAMLYAVNHDPRAQSLAERAYALYPSPATEDTLGWVVMGSGDVAKALTYLRPASSAMPRDPTMQYHLAAALKASGDKQAARTLLENALNSDQAFDAREQAKRLLDELKHS